MSTLRSSTLLIAVGIPEISDYTVTMHLVLIGGRIWSSMVSKQALVLCVSQCSKRFGLIPAWRTDFPKDREFPEFTNVVLVIDYCFGFLEGLIRFHSRLGVSISSLVWLALD